MHEEKRERNVKRRIIAVLLVAVVVLSACVPIPEDPQRAPDPETKAGRRDLAGALAKFDSQEDSSDYFRLLDGLYACMLDEIEGGPKGLEFSGAERDAAFIFLVGVLWAARTFELEMAHEKGLASPEETLSDERPLYSGLQILEKECTATGPLEEASEAE